MAAGTRNRYVNVARLAPQEAFLAATDEHFRSLVSRPAWHRFPSTPALFETVERLAAEPTDG